MIKNCRWCGCSYDDTKGYGSFCSRKCSNEYYDTPEGQTELETSAKIRKFFIVVIFFPIAGIIWMCKKSKTKARKIAKIIFGIIGIIIWIVLVASLIKHAGQ